MAKAIDFNAKPNGIDSKLIGKAVIPVGFMAKTYTFVSKSAAFEIKAIGNGVKPIAFRTMPISL